MRLHQLEMAYNKEYYKVNWWMKGFRDTSETLQRYFKDTSMADPSGRAGFCFARSSPNKRTNCRTGVRGKFLLQNIRNFQVTCQGESYDQKSEMLNVIYWPAPYILFFFSLQMQMLTLLPIPNISSLANIQTH